MEQKPRILVMDDEEQIRTTLARVFPVIGFDAEFADDGAQAVELYRKALEQGNKFQIVILDLNVPAGLMGGQAALRELLAIDPAVKALASSGDSTCEVCERPGDFGFAGVVIKPYTVEELRTTLNKTMEG